ncbi:hypothetical protein AMTRI_Chr10g490 [Amborella trichopoda]
MFIHPSIIIIVVVDIILFFVFFSSSVNGFVSMLHHACIPIIIAVVFFFLYQCCRHEKCWVHEAFIFFVLSLLTLVCKIMVREFNKIQLSSILTLYLFLTIPIMIMYILMGFLKLN